MAENIIFIFLVFLLFEYGMTMDGPSCPPITYDGLITCENQVTSNNCSESQPVGTMAKYRCKPFYILRDSSESMTRLSRGKREKSDGELRCGKEGRWIGLEHFKSTMCREDCGRPLTIPKPLIINGVPTNSTNWPWHVALFRRTQSSSIEYICGGTIISRSTILTVAHCVTNSKGETLLPNSTLVVLGAVSSDFAQNQGRIESQIIMVNKIYVSENYDMKKEFQADIAVLHLNKNIEYTDHVSPICLPNDFTLDTNAVTPGTLADVVGFGVDESGQIAPSLKHGTLEIKSHSECFVTLERILSESQFCAGSPREGHRDRVTVCNGDSGGGLHRPSIIDGKYYIHGIVSTGEPSRKRGPCQSHAVFTRVYSFITFIRDILSEIKDHDVLQLSSDTPFPYKQRGSEEERVRFHRITPEFRNKVTSIELSYVDIDPDVLLQSFESSKTLQSINFTNVKFVKSHLTPTRRPQILPLLKTFSLDVLMEDFVLKDERKFPLTLSKEFLRSYLFFEKYVEDVHVNSDIVRIPSLKTNIDLTVNIFKLLKINHEEWRVVLSQITFSNQILANLPFDFQLRHLALSRVPLLPSDFSLLADKLSNLETLVLDQVSGFRAQDLVQTFQISKRLKEFVLIHPKSQNQFEIFARDLSVSLKHLALTNTKLSLDGKGNPISFMVNDNERDRDLETFYCDSCVETTSDFSHWFKNLNNVYPKLRKLVFKFNDTVPITTSTFEHFEKLEFVIINLSGSVQLFNKKNGKWVMRSLKSSHGFNHLDYVLNRKYNFWSSEGDYVAGSRLRSYEKIGFETGHYRYNGKYENRRRITTIPKEIQNRFHTVEILNTAMSKQVFLNSFESAKEIKILRLINVSFTDYFVSDLKFPNLIEYRFDVQIIPQINTLSLKRILNLGKLLFRLFFLYEEDQPGFDLKNNILSTKVKKCHITYATCVLVSWDAHEGALISTLDYTNQWLRNVKQSNPVRKLAFIYYELDPASVPSTISDLSLNFAIVKDMGMILRRLDGLNSLKLINVRVRDTGNSMDWDWTQIDWNDLSKHSNTLDYLAIEKAHLVNHSPGMTFAKVEFLYLESCTFEKSFVRNFKSTFPNLKRLVILGGSDPRIQVYLDVIILGALKSNTVKWIFISQPVSGSSTNRFRNEINVILGRIGINQNDDSKYFILERTSSSEVWGRNSSLDDSKVESEVQEMKGMTDFGTYSQCHPISYKQGGWRGFLPFTKEWVF